MAKSFTVAFAFSLIFAGFAIGEEPRNVQQSVQPPAEEATVADLKSARLAARDRGLAWLAKHQSADGSWGKDYKTAITSFVVLAYLAAHEEPFVEDEGKTLTAARKYTLSQQQDGTFANQGHTWIHGQGFATLALSEAYGRSTTCKTKPDFDMDKVRDVVASAVKVIAENQSTSGGWWYTPGAKSQHEGSTTVSAVQALVSADNFGIQIDDNVLAREYLKQCQNKDGGFDYQMGPGETSMKEGTAGGVSTLGLMKKFDYAVMMNGYKFLLKITPQAITAERFPYYGHFYGTMGMRLLGQEFRSFQGDIDGYLAGVQSDLLKMQKSDGNWPVTGWMSSQQEGDTYSTAFASLTFSVADGRLSIFNRWKPGQEPPRRR